MKYRLLIPLIPVALGIWVLHAARITDEIQGPPPKEIFENADILRSFSATQANDTLVEAHAKNVDFLAFYLVQHFPEQVTESQMSDLRATMESLRNPRDHPSAHFRLGFACFFLALAETQRIAHGLPEEPEKITEHWKQAVDAFRRSRDLGGPWVKELEDVLRIADKNGDGDFSAPELASIIKERVSR